jgi:hypothetical protein
MSGIGRGGFSIVANTREPMLVEQGLTDIRLADGSSGLTAVDDFQAMGPIPTVFITALPEKLLIGKRSEPSFLMANV